MDAYGLEYREYEDNGEKRTGIFHGDEMMTYSGYSELNNFDLEFEVAPEPQPTQDSASGVSGFFSNMEVPTIRVEGVGQYTVGFCRASFSFGGNCLESGAMLNQIIIENMN